MSPLLEPAPRAARPPRTELPRWLSPTSVVWLGVALAAVVLALSAAFVWYEQREIHSRGLEGVELMARVVEDHASLTFNTIDITLSALTEAVRNSANVDPIRLGPMLALAQRGLPFIRSVSMLDTEGRVLASSVDTDVDVVVDPRRVPFPAGPAIDRLGSLVPGRDLSDAPRGSARAPEGAHNFIALSRAVRGLPGGTLYVVAVLNPDFFANEYQLMLGDDSRSAALVGLDGTLLTATEGVQAPPGTNVLAHRFFQDFLPDHESGSFIGAGLDGRTAVSALRVLRIRPVAVIVERTYASVQTEVARVAGRVALVGTAALLVIATLVVMAVRSLRSHAVVHSVLDDTRERAVSSERDLRTLVESVQELIFRTDAEGLIRFVNGRWRQITGHDMDAALGHRFARWCVSSDRERVDALFSRTSEQPLRSAMVQMRTPAGEVRTLELSVAVVLAQDQSINAFAGFAIDVSERQIARRKLEAQLDFTARLVEVSPTPLFVKDEQGRFLMVNRAWLDLMGLRAESVIGQTSGTLFGDDAPKHNAHDLRVTEVREPVRYENRLVRPDLEVRDTVVTKVRFSRADGGPGGIIGSIIDVTEFREAERTTREARDAAESANRTKSEFIANISHELRTPLQSILGFSEIGGSLSASAPDLQEMFGDIHAGGQRMLKLVNGLLDVSKMESTVGSLALYRRDLMPLVMEVVKELRPLASRRDVTIVLHERAAPLLADVDAFRIQQVLRNVLANAMRFSVPGTSVDIACTDLGSDGVEICVRDHGPGIPPGELETIFDAFVQSSRTRDGSGGTGLGLTICRKIMSAHAGTVVASNAAHGGALMRIRLPAARAVDPDAAPTDDAEAALGGRLDERLG